jgi:hypothetical protein
LISTGLAATSSNIQSPFYRLKIYPGVEPHLRVNNLIECFGGEEKVCPDISVLSGKKLF